MVAGNGGTSVATCGASGGLGGLGGGGHGVTMAGGVRVTVVLGAVRGGERTVPVRGRCGGRVPFLIFLLQLGLVPFGLLWAE